MNLSRATAKENLAKLVEKFEKETSSGRINDYNEEATKTAFIQPFLKNVLGWNVADRDEVSPEEKVSRGRVDYGLKIEGQIKLFIEVKPPRADLDKHIKQAVGYGYNRKSVPFVLLTDFEGLKLFDVTIKPDTRNPLKGLKIDLDWKEYLSKFDKIWLLSKESVLKGELEKLLLIKPKQRLPVDKAILDDLKKWREKLAKDIFKNNPNLFHSPPPSLPPRKGEEKGGGADYLKEITQRIIDRIMFMRSCEDRKLIHRRSLKELFEERTETVGTNTMVFLKEEFKHYNIIFDSDLFRPQDWEANLAIDFKVMKDIILDTYNPYQFDVIPLEVLGNIYEQYLGYTIRLTDHQVKYELKPDVRKAGGVYYTPEYIVDYIVKNTVGKLLQELPASRFLSFRAKRGISSKTKKLRILDPACGSGSFLIRAYEEMLNYYRSQKKKKSKLKKEQEKLDLEHETAEPLLTIEEKSKILREHIFGVDIDEQAVEVTKLSLMLKMLEGEFGIIPGRSILPMLDKNIRCGNSLISGDTLELKKYFGDDWYKVKAFNWKDAFRKIMVEEGGFDVVIGNPPYSLLQNISELKGFFDFSKNIYRSAQYKIDTYHLFLERGISLLNRKGRLGFITPNTFLKNKHTTKLRKFIIDNCKVETVVLIPEKVFPDASVDTTVIIIEREHDIKIRNNNIVRALHIKTAITEIETDLSAKKIKQSRFTEKSGYVFNLSIDENVQLWLEKIYKISIPLENFATAYFGIQTYDRSKYVTKKPVGSNYKPTIDGRNISRYRIDPKNEFVLLTSKSVKSGGNVTIYEQPKIVVRQIGKSPIATFDDNKYFSLNTVYNIILTKPVVSLKYILGILNSTLISIYWQLMFSDYKATFPKIKKAPLLAIPIRKIDVSNSADKKLHDNLVALVDVMLDLNKKIQIAKGSKKDQIQRQIEKSDKEIDDLVYKLYGITEEERQVIEGGG